MPTIIKTFAVILIAFAGCNGKNNKPAVSETKTDIELSNVILSDLEDASIDLVQFKGRTVFINFWATWCKPCIEEMPSIRNLMEQMKGENIVFLFASEETSTQIKRFKEKTGFDFPFVRVENLEELNIMALPTTYIFDPSGKLAISETGFRIWDDSSSIIQIKNIIHSK